MPRLHTRGTKIAPGGGMPSGRVPLQTKPKLQELLRDYYLDVQAAADDPDRKIACISGTGPVEIVRALGMKPYFPENHASLIGASRQSGRYIPRAISEGFSQFASSSMTCDIGAMLVGDSPLVSVYGIDGPPRPDVVVYNSNFGHGLIRWFEYYGRHFDVPVHGLHPPPALTEVDFLERSAAALQIHRLIERLEGINGEKLDMDKLAETVALSAKAAQLWSEILDLAQAVPTPLTFFDTLIHVAPMVLMRGTKAAVEYYTILKAELEERVANNIAAVPGERFRIYWEGPPIWCALRPLAELFSTRNVAVVASTYAHIFDLQGLDPKNPIESMAHAYTSIFSNRSDDYKERYLKSKFDEFGVDGVIYHEGRTAPEQSNVRYGLEVSLRRKTGIPTIVLEADPNDLRLFSMDQVMRKLEDFIEMQETHVAAGGGSAGEADHVVGKD